MSIGKGSFFNGCQPDSRVDIILVGQPALDLLGEAVILTLILPILRFVGCARRLADGQARRENVASFSLRAGGKLAG